MKGYDLPNTLLYNIIGIWFPNWGFTFFDARERELGKPWKVHILNSDPGRAHCNRCIPDLHWSTTLAPSLAHLAVTLLLE